MRKWFWIAPLILVAGCSRQPSTTQAATSVSAGEAAPDLPMRPRATPLLQRIPAIWHQPATLRRSRCAVAGEPAALAGVPVPSTGVMVPSGTPLRVRVDEAISTRRNVRGDRFTATLVSPVAVNGQTVLPAGTRLTGHVVASAASRRMKGRARLVLALDSFERNGRRYAIDTTAAAH